VRKASRTRQVTAAAASLRELLHHTGLFGKPVDRAIPLDRQVVPGLAELGTWLIASDEKKKFRREALARLGNARMLDTPGILILAIKAGLLTIEEADNAKTILEHHRFTMNFISFHDVLS